MGSAEGKVAVVTGGASLIGLAIARHFIAEGGRVVAGDRNESLRSEVEGALGDAGQYLSGDVTEDAYLDRLVAAAVEGFGRLDCIVTATAIFDDEGYASTWELWHRALDINMVAAARLTGKAVPYLRDGGAVVYVASVSGSASQPDRMVYNTTKAALLMLAKTGAQELSPDGIRVNAVSPGWTTMSSSFPNTWSGPGFDPARGSPPPARGSWQVPQATRSLAESCWSQKRILPRMRFSSVIGFSTGTGTGGNCVKSVTAGSAGSSITRAAQSTALPNEPPTFAVVGKAKT